MSRTSPGASGIGRLGLKTIGAALALLSCANARSFRLARANRPSAETRKTANCTPGTRVFFGARCMEEPPGEKMRRRFGYLEATLYLNGHSLTQYCLTRQTLALKPLKQLNLMPFITTGY